MASVDASVDLVVSLGASSELESLSSLSSMSLEALLIGSEGELGSLNGARK